MPRFIIHSLLIITLFASSYFYTGKNDVSASENRAVERERYNNQITELDQEANNILQELLLLDLKYKQASQKKDLVEKDLNLALGRRDLARAEYNLSLENRKKSLERVRPWVNFQYRFGYQGLLEIILDSDSVSDLVSRSALVWMVISRQMKAFNEADQACAATLQKEEALRQAVEELNSSRQSLDRQLRDISALAQQREDFLSEVRNNSRELAGKIVSLEQDMLYNLNLFNLLISLVGKFPWEGVQPESITPAAGGIRVVISENSLNQSLQSSGDPDLRNLSVDLRPGTFALDGKGGKSTPSFVLEGALTPCGHSSSVLLDITNFSLDGIPLNNTVLQEFKKDSPVFSPPLPEGMKAFNITGIEIMDNKVALTIRPM